MQALVTGCAGFVGSHLTDALLARGDRVRGVDAFTDYYSADRKHHNLDAAARDERFELVEADLRVCDLIELLDGVDVVFHEAGQPGVRTSWATGFPEYVGHNVLATQRLLEALHARPVRRLVYASSSSIYGNAARYPTTEEDTPRPHSPYGVTKLAAEHLCNLYADNWGIPTVSLRYFTVYGPRQRPDMAFTRFIEAARSGRALPIFGDGEQVRDFTYVSDAVAATIAAAERDVAPGTVMNVAGGSSTTVNALLALLSELLGTDVQLEHFPAQRGDVERTGGAIDRARAAMGWEPRVSLRSGLAQQIEWADRALHA
jgi:nucleoside-diphosphate-sugar epimerase